MKKLFSFLLVGVFSVLVLIVHAQTETYQKPPKELIEILTAKPNPTVEFSNDYKSMALLQRNSYFLELEDIAGDEYRIAGIRINPNNFSQTRQSYNQAISLKVNGKDVAITNLPAELQVSNVSWSPSDKYVVFTNTTAKEVELWRVTVATGEAKKINVYPVNAVTLRQPYEFLDDERILYAAVPEESVKLPVSHGLPTGPVVQQVYGKKEGGRTIADVITSPEEENIFEFMATAQLAIYSAEGTKKVGTKGIFSSLNFSPDKNYVIVRTHHKPYSYLLSYTSFPAKSELWAVADGQVLKTLSDNTKTAKKPDPNAKKEPQPSGYGWRADQPATLYWSERAFADNSKKDDDDAADKDDAKDAKDNKDKPEKTFQTSVYQQPAPFTAEKQLVVVAEYNFGGIIWGNDKIALYNDSSSKQKIRRLVRFVPMDTNAKQQVLMTTSTEIDSVAPSPVMGRPYTVKNQYGSSVLYTDKDMKYIYLSGANRPDAEGDRMSFFDRMDLKTLAITPLWMGKAPYNTTLVDVLNFKDLTFLVSRQSPTEPTNYYTLNVKKNSYTPITSFTDPVPQLRELGREFITYKRKDGVTLTGLLITPKGYDKERDGKLPVFMWAYPYEYKTRVEAEKVRAPRYSFLSNSSAAIMATQGYAVLQDISMYIISDNKDQEPNDVFIKNLVANAEAAIDYVDSIGVGDRNRVAVGGHSYGSFMTAHLLSQTNLFTAGVARSGAFNRTLTPFGFQSESRSYWKDPELYYKMSPFSYVDKLKTPILLIHGELDENSGTFPVQSNRMYQALSYFGATSRYVVLPYETHGYRALPNVLQLWWETTNWLDKYTKNTKPKKAATPKADTEKKAAEIAE